jgi:hypothetical protein
MVWPRPLSSSEGKHYSIQWYSKQFCASNLGAKVWEDPFLFQHDLFIVQWSAQSKVHREMVCRDRVKEHDWPTQSPDLNPIVMNWNAD